MKKGLLILVLLCALIAALTVSVSAAQVQEGSWRYSVADNEATVIQYLGAEENVVIPDALGGYPVTAIASTAFSNNTQLRAVTFPASVHTIEDGKIELVSYEYVYFGAFNQCTNLKTVSIPADSKLRYIGECAFSLCTSLTDITLPASVRTLATSSFENCESLTEFILPEGLETIGQNALPSGLRHLRIPSTCREVSSWNTLPALEAVTVAEGNNYYRSHEGVLYERFGPSGYGAACTLTLYPIRKPEAVYRVPDFCEYICGDGFDTSYGVPALQTLYIGDCRGAIGATGGDSLSRISADVIPDDTNAYYQNIDGMLLSKDGKTLVQVSHSASPKVTVPKTVRKLEGYVFFENQSVESVYFTGDAPEFDESTFWQSVCTLFYPKNNPTWTQEYFQTHTQYYWGSIRWSGYLLDAEGLNCVDGVWGYYEDNQLQTEYTGFALYNGMYFYVVDGILDFTYTGLGYFEGEWRYVANSLLTEDFTGLAYYNNTWFYIQNSRIPWTYTGMVEYEGNQFYVQNNELDWSYTGLGYHDGQWYFIQNALMRRDYRGLVNFNDTWFYVENGHLTWDYTGMVEHDGNRFYVQNNVLDWGYTGLGYHNGGWYFIQNALLQGDYNGLVNFNDTWFYIEDGELTWQTNGLRKHGENLFYITNSEVDWSYNGTAEYEGVVYRVVNGLAVSSGESIDLAALAEYGRSYGASAYGFAANSGCYAGYYPATTHYFDTMEEGKAAVRSAVSSTASQLLAFGPVWGELEDGTIWRASINVQVSHNGGNSYTIWVYYG